MAEHGQHLGFRFGRPWPIRGNSVPTAFRALQSDDQSRKQRRRPRPAGRRINEQHCRRHRNHRHQPGWRSCRRDSSQHGLLQGRHQRRDMGCLSRRAGIEPLLRHVTDQQLLWRNFLRGEIDAGGIAVGSSAVALIPLIESASVSLKVPRMVFLDELLEFWHSCFLQAGHQNVLDVGGFFAMPLNHKEVGTAGLEQWKYAGNRKYFSRSIYHAWATSEVRGPRLEIVNQARLRPESST